MKTPVQYQHEIDQAMAAENGKPSQEQLVAIERSLQMDIRALQVQFLGRSTSQIGRMSNQGGKTRAEGEKRLDDEKTARLKPYQELLEKILTELKTFRQ